MNSALHYVSSLPAPSVFHKNQIVPRTLKKKCVYKGMAVFVGSL